MRTEICTALLLFSACGPMAATTPAPERPALRVARMLPPQTSFVASVSFSQLRETEIYKTGYQLLLDELRYSNQDAIVFIEALKSRCGIDVFGDLQWGLVAGGADMESELAIVMGVSFGEEKLNSCTDGFGIDREMKGKVAHYEGMNTWVTWPSPEVMAVVFDEDALGFLLQVANGGSSSGPGPELSALLSSVDTEATIWGAATNLSGEDSLYEAFDLDEFTEHETLPLTGSLSIDLRQGVKLRNEFRFPSASDASRVTADWNKLLGFAIPVGSFTPYISKILVRAEDVSALVLAELNVEETQSLRQLSETMFVAERDRERRSDREWEEGQEERDAERERERLATEQREAEERAAEAKRQAALAQEQRLAAERLAAANQAMRTNEAKAHSDQGRAFLDAGVFDKAVEEFKAANALVPHADFLYNIAFSYDNQRNSEQQALDYYQRYLSAAPTGTMAQVSRRRVANITKKLRSKK